MLRRLVRLSAVVQAGSRQRVAAAHQITTAAAAAAAADDDDDDDDVDAGSVPAVGLYNASPGHTCTSRAVPCNTATGRSSPPPARCTNNYDNNTTNWMIV